MHWRATAREKNDEKNKNKSKIKQNEIQAGETIEAIREESMQHIHTATYIHSKYCVRNNFKCIRMLVTQVRF